MSILTTNAVVMGCVAHDKTQALAQVAKALFDQGLVSDGDEYYQALQLREAQANTYLGSAIAIPHGTPAFKEQVQNTGVVLVHFADGVDWGDGQIVYVAAGIAAKSDEHLGVLKLLARTLGDEGLADKLKTAQTPEQIVALLTKGPVQTDDNLASYLLLDTQAIDIENMMADASKVLKNHHHVHSGFLTQLSANPVICLNQTLWCVQASTGVNSSAVVVVGVDQPIAYQQGQVQYLMVMADDGTLSQKLDSTLELLLTMGDINNATLQALFNQDPYKDYHHAQVLLANRHGLHARPATYLSKVASNFAGDVQVGFDGNFVSAKSLTRLLSLGATYGQQLSFKVEPIADGEAHLQALIKAVQSGLGEEVTPIVHHEPKDTNDVLIDDLAVAQVAPLERGQQNYGIIASKGIAIAPAFVVKEKEFDYEKLCAKGQEAQEKAKLDSAINKVKSDLGLLITHAKTAEIAGIFSAHRSMLDDGEIIAAVHRHIDQGLSAPMAWHSEIEALATAQAALDNPLLAQRAADFKDIGRRVLAALCGETLLSPEGNYILVKEDLLPSDVATLGDNVVAIITSLGGANSHSAIIARSLGIPALVGVGLSVLDIYQGEMVLVDAIKGHFVVAPQEELIQATIKQKTLLKQKLNTAKLNAHEMAKTKDGHRVEVMANLGDVANATAAVAQGAEGVGLLRTEFVFMKHSSMPNKQTQITDYSQVFDAMENRPVVVRTLDIGGDKPLPYLAMKAEENPFLGVRGIRLCLQRPELLKEQLTALIEASNNRPLRIMFPMVGQMSEWRAAKAILDDVLQTHPHSDLQVGIMIEVPSAAILADEFAKEVDFFSIGTNDLTQYALAIDRGHPVLSAQSDGLHASVLRLIDMTIKAAHAHGKWVGVCGELGSDELAVPILIGLGVDELSVSVSQIALVKAQIRTLSIDDCRALAAEALACDGATAVRALAQKFADTIDTQTMNVLG